MLTVVEVKTKSALKKFINFPVDLYRAQPNYVPNFYGDEIKILNPKKNPSLAYSEIKCWLCYSEKRIVGRIAGIIQRQDNELSGKNYIRFSRVDFIEDKEVAFKLFDTVAAWGREKGMDRMHGPWGFNDQDREGMLTFGFDEKSTLITNYSNAYYVDYVYEYGMKDECEWLEYRFSAKPNENDRVLRVAKMVKDRVKVREIADECSNREIVKKWGHPIFDLINESYKNLNCYVPVEGAVVDEIVGKFAPMLDKRFISLIVNDKEELVGFAIAIASITDAVTKSKGKLFPIGWLRVLKAKKKCVDLEWLLIGVRPDYQARGLNAMMLARITQNALKYCKVPKVDSDCMLTTNTEVLAQLETLPHEIVRRRKCFEMEI